MKTLIGLPFFKKQLDFLPLPTVFEFEIEGGSEEQICDSA